MIAAWSPSSQLRVVDARHRAGAHYPFQLETGMPRHLADRLLERDLHLGQRQDRHPHRQLFVEHVVLANIAVRQHIVAELLGIPEPRAVAERAIAETG